MKDKDWNMFLEMHPMLKDIEDWMLRPYGEWDLKKHQQLLKEETNDYKATGR